MAALHDQLVDLHKKRRRQMVHVVHQSLVLVLPGVLEARMTKNLAYRPVVDRRVMVAAVDLAEARALLRPVHGRPR